MKRTIKLLTSLSLSLLLIQPSGYGASAQFSDKGKHWYIPMIYPLNTGD